MSYRYYKKLGETSFQCVERFREENPEYKDQKIAFAGRLDPMAEGEMLILVGDETVTQDDYLGLDKTYETEFVFGLATDSFDLMGLIQNTPQNTKSFDQEKIKEAILSYVGKQMQKFPPFSKRHVKGKALFVWASEGRLSEIEIPEHEVEIYKIDISGFDKISLKDLAEESIERIKNVKGDFRQDKIIAQWQEILDKVETKETQNLEFLTLKLKIKCGTGTYIRQLAEDVGKELGTGTLVRNIKREAIHS